MTYQEFTLKLKSRKKLIIISSFIVILIVLITILIVLSNRPNTAIIEDPAYTLKVEGLGADITVKNSENEITTDSEFEVQTENTVETTTEGFAKISLSENSYVILDVDSKIETEFTQNGSGDTFVALKLIKGRVFGNLDDDYLEINTANTSTEARSSAFDCKILLTNSTICNNYDGAIFVTVGKSTQSIQLQKEKTITVIGSEEEIKDLDDSTTNYWTTLISCLASFPSESVQNTCITTALNDVNDVAEEPEETEEEEEEPTPEPVVTFDSTITSEIETKHEITVLLTCRFNAVNGEDPMDFKVGISNTTNSSSVTNWTEFMGNKTQFIITDRPSPETLYCHLNKTGTNAYKVSNSSLYERKVTLTLNTSSGGTFSGNFSGEIKSEMYPYTYLRVKYSIQRQSDNMYLSSNGVDWIPTEYVFVLDPDDSATGIGSFITPSYTIDSGTTLTIKATVGTNSTDIFDTKIVSGVTVP